MGRDLFSMNKQGLRIGDTLCLVRSWSVASAYGLTLLSSLLPSSIRSLSNCSVIAVVVTVDLQQQRRHTETRQRPSGSTRACWVQVGQSLAEVWAAWLKAGGHTLLWRRALGWTWVCVWHGRILRSPMIHMLHLKRGSEINGKIWQQVKQRLWSVFLEAEMMIVFFPGSCWLV